MDCFHLAHSNIHADAPTVGECARYWFARFPLPQFLQPEGPATALGLESCLASAARTRWKWR